MTSELLAKAMETNPVVIGPIMAGLRRAGYLRTENGHWGGGTLACELNRVTLRDIDELERPHLLAIGTRTKLSGCLVEQAVDGALSKSFEDAETLLLARFGEVTLAMLAADVDAAKLQRHAEPGGDGQRVCSEKLNANDCMMFAHRARRQLALVSALGLAVQWQRVIMPRPAVSGRAASARGERRIRAGRHG
jgi:DNA-binding IscR family transcriptional regulator